MVGIIGSTPGSVITPSGPVNSTSGVVAGQTATQQTSSATLAALSQNLATALIATGLLGLGKAVNPEDASAILAEAEAKLDETSSQTRGNRIQNSFATGHNAVSSLAAGVYSASVGVAKDGADTADDVRAIGSLTELQGQQELTANMLQAAQTSLSAAANDLSESGVTNTDSNNTRVVNDYAAALKSLTDAKNSIQSQILQAKTTAVTNRQASLQAQVDDVNQRISAAQTLGDASLLSQLNATKAGLQSDYANVAHDLDVAYGTVLLDSTADLQSAITYLQNAPDKSASPTRYHPGADAKTMAGYATSAGNAKSSIETALTTTTGQITAKVSDIATLAFDAGNQLQAVANLAARLIPIFSQIATDILGGGAHARDVAQSTALSEGFDDLDATSRRFRENDGLNAAEDAKRREAASDGVDTHRVADLAAGLAAGLGDLRSVLRQEAASSPDPVANGAALTVGERFRLWL